MYLYRHASGPFHKPRCIDQMSQPPDTSDALRGSVDASLTIAASLRAAIGLLPQLLPGGGTAAQVAAADLAAQGVDNAAHWLDALRRSVPPPAPATNPTGDAPVHA